MPISKNIKTLIWKPSGGLGHCLHNLAWTYDFCIKQKCKLYIYGFNLHQPFQYYADEFLEFKHNVDYEELKNEQALQLFFKKYNIQKQFQSLVYNARYKSQLKYLDVNKSIAVVCGTWCHNPKSILSFKPAFIEDILSQPYKFYNDDYTLFNGSDNTNNIFSFGISGSYVRALGIHNKDFKITKKDIDYIKQLKTLIVNYTLYTGEKQTIICIEKTPHTINNIKNIDSATYGIKDKVIDVTHIVKHKLCTVQQVVILDIPMTFSIKGSFYKTLRITNKQLGILKDDKEHYNKLKELKLKYNDQYHKPHEVVIKENTDTTICNITKIVSAIYGIGKKNIDITKNIIKKCCVKNEQSHQKNMIINKPPDDIEKQKKQIYDILKSKKYIAVHFRYRDKKVRGGYIKKLKEIKELIHKTKIDNIFIATDSPMFFNYIINELKHVNVFRYTNPPTYGKNIHYNTKDFTKGENLYKTLLDLYICKKATHFIQSEESGFSKMYYEI
jgi:hypothetical protein